MSKLVNGRIPANTSCPYSDECGSVKNTACNGKGCPVSEGQTIESDFSCGAARLLDMVNKKGKRMVEINKKVLSAVLGKDIKEFTYCNVGDEFDFSGTYLEYSKNSTYHGSSIIHLDELVRKCKKWGLSQGYEIVERQTQVDVYKNNKRVVQFIGDSYISFKSTRVYEACEWILKERSNG